MIRPLLALLMGLASACVGLRTSSTLLLVHEGDHRLPEVVVRAGELELWRGPLEPRARHEVPYRPERDAAFEVVVRLPDGVTSTHQLGYTTRNDGQVHAVTIGPGGEVRYSVGTTSPSVPPTTPAP